TCGWGACLLSQGRWFTPSDFEQFAGKGSYKNWKLSIRCQNTPLQNLIKVNSLAKMEESVEEGEAVDLSEFQAPSLPVSCGSVSGVLFKSRFASGTRGKSIRTEECWFTPEEFMKQELTLTDGCWKRDIKCHGKTLSDLLPLDQDNDDECFICNSDGHLVCCDECPRAFHDKCHIPTLHAKELGNKWMCTYCVLKNSQCWWRHRTMTEEQALNSPVSQYIVVTLPSNTHTYKHTHHTKTHIYSTVEFIAEPMWLDRVKDKLHSQKYETLRHFVSDISLIFQNCNTFNRVRDKYSE
uniref:SP110 nuclear body protein, tandem duplicate 1 n=1 Tax=Electrophorus electricus TaxID=8005 RepID=A0AAY5EXV8_ELEEL